MNPRAGGTRTERDFLGEVEVPDRVYFGVHTARALENFPISGVTIGQYPRFISALGAVKQAAACANRELGLLASKQAGAVVRACEEIRAGRFEGQFLVDVVQGGAGTSTNMNINEVIANRALELMGYPRGDYVHLHPIDHVNMGQSTNDVYPTGMKLAASGYALEFLTELGQLRESFAAKAIEFRDIVKIGRTQLQDAVPMTLGQEFATYATTIAEDELRLEEARMLLHEINIGGTAIGTGLNAHPEYQEKVLTHLRAVTGLDTLVGAPDLIEATWDTGAFVQLSSVLKRIAVKLSKICNDLRLLSSGPQAGFNEIDLPAVQAGSSIMPAKINPVIPEALNQVAFEVIGHDLTITMAAEGGQLQLNAFEPIIAKSLFEMFEHLITGCAILRSRCIDGITANEDVLQDRVAKSVALVTALNPAIGYAAAADIAHEAMAKGRRIVDLVVEGNLLSPEAVEELLCSYRLTGRKRPVG